MVSLTLNVEYIKCPESSLPLHPLFFPHAIHSLYLPINVTTGG